MKNYSEGYLSYTTVNHKYKFWVIKGKDLRNADVENSMLDEHDWFMANLHCEGVKRLYKIN